MAVNADFNSPEVIANPFPALARIRQAEPVHWNDSLKGWCLTRFDDVCLGYTDKRFSAERIRPFLESQNQAGREYLHELGAVFLLWLPFLDPPRHTRLRKLMSAGFTLRACRERVRFSDHCGA